MFRVVMCVATCALPLVMSSSVGAQSFVSVTGESDIASPVSSGPPKSITQRYVPRAAAPARPRGLPIRGLLIDESAPPAAPAAAIAAASPEPIARAASAEHGMGRPVIVVSNVKAVGRE